LQEEKDILKAEILEGKKIIGTKVEEYTDKIKLLQQKFNKQERENIEKCKALQNKIRFVEIEKIDEIKKYEKLVANLTERIYKTEGKKFNISQTYNAGKRSNSRPKSGNETINKIISKSLYKKELTQEDDEFMDEVNKNYIQKKDQMGVNRYLRKNYSTKKERNNLELEEFEDTNQNLNYKIERIEKEITDLNKEYNALVVKLNISNNENELNLLKKKIKEKESQIENESRNLRKLKQRSNND